MQHCPIASFGSRFHLFHLVINLLCNRNICCQLKRVFEKSRAWVYFEQQILDLLLVFHQTHYLLCNKFPHVVQQVKDFCILYFTALKISNFIPDIFVGHKSINSRIIYSYVLFDVIIIFI